METVYLLYIRYCKYCVSVFLLGLYCLVNPTILVAQTTENDSIEKAQNLERRQLKYHFTADFFTAFSLTHIINQTESNEDGNVYLYYNITINNNLSFREWSLDTYYFTDFGLKKYFDSIAIIEADEYNFRNTLSYALSNSKFSVQVSWDTKSQYHKHYTYETDSLGQLQPILNSCYLSPGYKGFSAGLRYSHKYFTLDLGLVNGVKTIIRKQEIYDAQEVDELYGVPKGEKSRLEYGVNLVFMLPTQQLGKHFFWENASQFNVANTNIKQINRYCFDINNAIHYTFFNYFRLSLRTKCVYDFLISPKVNIVNNLSIGFYINNTF